MNQISTAQTEQVNLNRTHGTKELLQIVTRITNHLTHTPLDGAGWRRVIGCPVFIGHFPQKSCVISGSFAINDLQLKALFRSSPPCTHWLNLPPGTVHMTLDRTQKKRKWKTAPHIPRMIWRTDFQTVSRKNAHLLEKFKWFVVSEQSSRP